MKAKKVYEAIGDVLKPKSDEEIEKALDLEKLAGLLFSIDDDYSNDKDTEVYDFSMAGYDFGMELKKHYNGNVPHDPDDGDMIHPFIVSKIEELIDDNYPEWSDQNIDNFWEGITDGCMAY